MCGRVGIFGWLHMWPSRLYNIYTYICCWVPVRDDFPLQGIYIYMFVHKFAGRLFLYTSSTLDYTRMCRFGSGVGHSLVFYRILTQSPLSVEETSEMTYAYYVCATVIEEERKKKKKGRDGGHVWLLLRPVLLALYEAHMVPFVFNDQAQIYIPSSVLSLSVFYMFFFSSSLSHFPPIRFLFFFYFSPFFSFGMCTPENSISRMPDEY